MLKKDIALQIMITLIENDVDKINTSFRSQPNQAGVKPEKVAEFYNILLKTINLSPGD